MGDQYVCIGPYVEMKARAEIEEEDFPPHHPLGEINLHFHSFKYNVKFCVKRNRFYYMNIVLFRSGCHSSSTKRLSSTLWQMVGGR